MVGAAVLHPQNSIVQPLRAVTPFSTVRIDFAQLQLISAKRTYLRTSVLNFTHSPIRKAEHHAFCDIHKTVLQISTLIGLGSRRILIILYALRVINVHLNI